MILLGFFEIRMYLLYVLSIERLSINIRFDTLFIFTFLLYCFLCSTNGVEKNITYIKQKTSIHF